MFRSFEAGTADEVWQQVVQVLRVCDGVMDQPSSKGPTRELLHAAISIQDPRQRWVVSRRPALNIAFAMAEVVWIMTGRNDLGFLKAWNGRLPQYVGEGPQLHGAYGYRLRCRMGMDQLTRAYQALRCNPDTRQVVLQIWDSGVDFPQADGSPADQDIPCSVLALLKVRENKLEWLQIIRSNDVFLGTPYNFVQFTCLQEVMAGWLGVDCGAYHQVSDSLHMYGHDEEKVASSAPVRDLPASTDSLALPKEQSEAAFRELGQRVEQMIALDLQREELERLAVWGDGLEAFRNMLAVLVSEAARRRQWLDISDGAMAKCSNPLYQLQWDRWLARWPRESAW